MKINIDEIGKRNDPYQLFLDGIKDSDTKRKYKNYLYKFLKLIPSEIYKKNLGKSPHNDDVATLSSFFTELAKKQVEIATDIIATYIKEEKKIVESGELSSGTLSNHVKPIKVLMDANRIPIHWKSLYRLYPRQQTVSKDRGYSRAELQKMIQIAGDITDKVIVTLFSSAGFRLEAWDYFTWKDLRLFKSKDGAYKGGAILVYEGDRESYWTHFTPETCIYLESYREKWRSDIGDYPKPDQPLLKAVKYPTIHRLNSHGVKKRIEKLAKAIGMRNSLPEGKKRYEVPLDHGFRKYFNTNLRRAKIDFLDKEDMMGHKVGLERHYERYQEEDFERFPEYQKAIPFLTISDEERLRFENQQKQGEIQEIEQKNLELLDMARRIDELENGPRARTSEFFKNMFEFKDDPAGQVWFTIFQMWFEMRATEDEKRTIWKKIQDAKKNGKMLDISELGKSGGLSLKNVLSSTKS